MSHGSPEAARQLLEEGLELHPRHVEALVALARLHRLDGDAQGAWRLLRQAQSVGGGPAQHGVAGRRGNGGKGGLMSWRMHGERKGGTACHGAQAGRGSSSSVAVAGVQHYY